MCDFIDCVQHQRLSCNDSKGSIFLKPVCYRPVDKPCLGCIMADTLLQMAVTAVRERLITMDDKEHDAVFKRIETYLSQKHPPKGGLPALD